MTDLKFSGHTLPKDMVGRLVTAGKELSVPPSYLITKLHYEGLWGGSNIARENNNWSGMTWTGDPKRPSGVVVEKGSARPAKEGGHYMRYKTISDWLKDWLYLIRRDGPYKVADSSTFDEAVKGMFRHGGAKYDYATMNVSNSKQRYELYLKGMKNRREAINQANSRALDNLDKGKKGDVKMAATSKEVLDIARGYLGAKKYDSTHRKIVDAYNAVTPRPVGYKATYDDDWCDVFVTHIFDKAGASDLSGRECGVQRHLGILKNKGIWKGRSKPKPGDIIIFDWQGHSAGWADHIGIVEKFDGKTVTTIEGNSGSPRAVRRRTYPWNANVIVGYGRPKFGEGTVAKPQTAGKVKTVTIRPEATKWQTGESIADKVKGKSFKVAQEKQADGKKVYLLMSDDYYEGWLYEHDTVEYHQEKKKKELLPLEEIAKKVINGEYGVIPERKTKLEEEGYDYAKVQNEVEKQLSEPAQKATADEPKKESGELILRVTIKKDGTITAVKE